MTFGKQVREWRRRRFLTQQQLAEQLGVSYMTVQRWELGQSLPRLSQQKKLIEVLEISPDEFFLALPEGKAAA